MQLMRIGAVGAEKPVVRVDDTHYVDVSDLTVDFDERFFGSGGIARLAGPVAERVATGDVRPFGDERIGAPIAGRTRSSASGSTTATTPPRPDRPCRASRSCSPRAPTR